MSAGPEWGPLARLAGIWEGDQGEDVAFANERREVGLTPFREHVEFKPFGPVENGEEVLYGLDYRMATWRGIEDNPFHSEVGYWLWDAAASQVMKCFIIARGSAVIAGATVAADATHFTLRAEHGSPTYGLLSNPFLEDRARAVNFQVTIDTTTENEFFYNETTVIVHALLPENLDHTDRNTLKRIADA